MTIMISLKTSFIDNPQISIKLAKKEILKPSGKICEFSPPPERSYAFVAASFSSFAKLKIYD